MKTAKYFILILTLTGCSLAPVKDVPVCYQYELVYKDPDMGNSRLLMNVCYSYSTEYNVTEAPHDAIRTYKKGETCVK